MIVEFKNVPRFIRRDQYFVNFFSRPEAYGIPLASRSQHMCHVRDRAGRYLGYEQFAANHVFQALQYEFDPLIKRDQKTGHLGVGDGQLTRFPLLGEQRNDATTTANDATVTDDGTGGAPSPA